MENVQLLSERATALLAKELRSTNRVVVLTSTPGCHLGDEHASLAGLCGSQRRLAPLRHRRPEIPRLAQQMLATAAGTADVRLTAAALNVLAAQSWPGNLSELRRVVERLARARSAGDITPADIPPSHRRRPAPASPFAEAERDVILAAVDAAHGNKVRAAQALGISRSTLYNRIRALRLDC